MNIVLRLLYASLILLLVATMGTAQTQAPAQELAGVWEGTLQVDPTTAVAIQFSFARKPDGSYSALLNSADGPIRNIAAGSVGWKDGRLRLQVTSLSGSYEGTLMGGAITGRWQQPGGALPLILRPYRQPILSKAAMATLVGSWNGPVGPPGNAVTYVVEFKLDDKGELEGTLAVPDQGTDTRTFSDIQFADNKLTVRMTLAAGVPGVYSATYLNGTFDGLWRQGTPLAPPAGIPVILRRGAYAAQVHVLKLSAESFGMLSGSWQGKLSFPGPQGQLIIPLALRFETNRQAQMVGFMESPSRGVKDVPITEASLVSGKLIVKVGSLNAEYDAALTGNNLTGQWLQGPGRLPLTMMKE
jgi:hypothetical protein